MLRIPRATLTARLVCYFRAKLFKPSVWQATPLTKLSDDTQLKSSVHTYTHPYNKGDFYCTQDFYPRAGLPMAPARHAALVTQKSACTKSAPCEEQLIKGVGKREEAPLSLKVFTSWRVRCLPSFLFESNLPYIALYFLISSSLWGSSSLISKMWPIIFASFLFVFSNSLTSFESLLGREGTIRSTHSATDRAAAASRVSLFSFGEAGEPRSAGERLCSLSVVWCPCQSLGSLPLCSDKFPTTSDLLAPTLCTHVVAAHFGIFRWGSLVLLFLS